MHQRLHYTITEMDQELPIKELLKRRLGLSSRFMRKLKQQDLVSLNGIQVRMNTRGRAGDRIDVTIPKENSWFSPEPIPIAVLYEDSDLLAIDKQPGFVVHPTKGHASNTIANGLMHRMVEAGESYKIRFINRLDMDTSGVLLIGKNSHCQDAFTKQAASGEVVKEYLAIVRGVPTPWEGRIDLPVGKPEDDLIRRAVIPEGDPSVTTYRVLEQYGREWALVFLRLETGRTHQIRVHLSHLGHPVVGDALYGGPPHALIQRQALHAVKLEFNHPVTKKRMVVEAPLPEDMDQLITALRETEREDGDRK